jgi:hypothetical protein
MFLVGINPAADVPLWPYWSPSFGVDKTAWLNAYLQKRRFSNTRRRIEWLIGAIGPEVGVLETNVFHHSSSRERELAKELRNPRVFELLLKTLRPKVVFAHGESAIREFEKIVQSEFERGDFTTVNYAGSTLDVFSDKHLYNWRRDRVEHLGGLLRERWAIRAE